MKIDSHHHFWNYDPAQYPWIDSEMELLRQDYAPEDLRQEIDAAGVSGVVSVQARQSLAETEWLLGLAAQHEFEMGVVGWIPLADDKVQQTLERFSHAKFLKGVRHVVQDEPDAGFILRDDFNRGVAALKDYGLIYDILIFSKHLENTIQFVDQHPQQVFVLDHIAKPTIRRGRFDRDWQRSLAELAKRENVSCKFSGVVTEIRDRDFDLDTIAPYLEAALEAFGSDRLMFGSDWPVCLLRTGYLDWIEAITSLTADLSSTEQAKFWGGNAARVYSLEMVENG